MSAEARAEAIEVVARELHEYNWAPPMIDCRPVAESLVDKLLETHAISRRAPRSYRLGTAPPRALPGQRPDGRTRI